MITLHSTSTQQRPWFKEPWLWLIILLPISAVIAGIITVIIAQVGADDLVVDDYYKIGISINHNIETEERAAQLGIKGRLFFSGEKVQLQLQQDNNQASNLPSKLMLDFFHPTLQGKDISIEMQSISYGLYSANFSDTKLSGKRYLRITPDTNFWSLKQQLTIKVGQPILFNARK